MSAARAARPSRAGVSYRYPAEVVHVRTGPAERVPYRLRQRLTLWLVDVDRPPRLPGPLGRLIGFDPRDHLDRRGPDLRSAVDRFLRARGLEPVSGPIRMLAQARVLGRVFDPLTVFWCHDADGALRWVLAEVRNTHGERHCYLLDPGQAGAGAGPPAPVPVPVPVPVPKEFYVSPFLPLAGGYRMRLPLPGERLALAVRLDTPDGHRLTATVRGGRTPGGRAALARALPAGPWAAVSVPLGIRFHGVRLWARGIPVRPRPRHTTQEGLK
ncbi:DUF1365 domain-containing protein [Streptomyces sp. BI20]|uniref:DUF1365 domain-containing protein n=1 Tax=Streptomyces sp. BI20 TaxID=3403460 RepID=UPI003C70EEDD